MVIDNFVFAYFNLFCIIFFSLHSYSNCNKREIFFFYLPNIALYTLMPFRFYSMSQKKKLTFVEKKILNTLKSSFDYVNV